MVVRDHVEIEYYSLASFDCIMYEPRPSEIQYFECTAFTQSPALNGSLEIQCFERSDVIEDAME